MVRVGIPVGKMTMMVIGEACSSRCRRRLRPPALIVLRLLLCVPSLGIVLRVSVLVGVTQLMLLVVLRVTVTAARRHHGVQWLR